MSALEDPQTTGERPMIRLRPGAHKRAKAGHPWIYSNEVVMDPAAKALPPGGLVGVTTDAGEALGVATFNPHPLISARLMARDAAATVDAGFLEERLRSALALRDRLVPEPYYRLVHAESDGLPGLVIDRFGATVVCQLNTAGMDRLWPALETALDRVLAPTAIVLRNDAAGREQEGLPADVTVPRGEIASPVTVRENGATHFADLAGGQKTGWFFDQRENRRAVREIADGAEVLDLYSYTGGFAVQAALGGARSVLAVDRSAAALALAEQGAAASGVGDTVATAKADVFPFLHRANEAGERYDVVIADPPAFVKSKKDYHQGAKGYRKTARLSAGLVRPGGFLLICSCSHNMDAEGFLTQVRRGLHDAGREARVLRASGAGPDHPVHPFLPETAYLKALLLAVD